MKTLNSSLIVLASLATGTALWAQPGPYSPENWPATIDNTRIVHYVVTDAGLEPPGETWVPASLQILTGSDHGTTDYCISGHACKKVTGNNLNTLDTDHTVWADKPTIDILMQVYGDAALFAANGNPRNFVFLTGDLSTLTWQNAGQVPVAANNRKWNWILFRIPNAPRGDGLNVVGGAPAPGGVNGGTIRLEGAPNLIVRAIAFGEEGAFGTPEDINQFSPPGATCDMPEPETNLASIDIHVGTADHMQVLNDGDQTVTYVSDVGPASDKRKAVVPDGLYLNFGITDNYLGKPCNDSRAVKVCVDFYDDPAFAGMGVHFGPEAYALDAGGCIGFYPGDQRVELAGSGEWIRRSWTIPAVSLKGVNAGTLTAGPRFLSEGGQVAVSRFALAVLREGSHPLAGQDPLAECVEDMNICRGLYGNYAELDLSTDLRDGLDLGTNTGDQEYVVEETGPFDDRRLAVRSAQDEGVEAPYDWYLNVAITGERFGPNTQDPALLAICATYYDDPDQIGKQLKPEAYVRSAGGVTAYAWMPDSALVTLEGTGRWRRAYWEIGGMKFNGVNQGPQAAARFWQNGKIGISRLRYAAIRPCGPDAGVNLLEGAKPFEVGVKRAGSQVEISWPGTAEPGWLLFETGDLTAPILWNEVAATPAIENNRYVVRLPLGDARFYRMAQ